MELEQKLDAMDNYYGCYKTYLVRCSDILDIMSKSDDFHDESVDYLHKAFLRSAELKQKYFNLFLNAVAMAEDDGENDL